MTTLGRSRTLAGAFALGVFLLGCSTTSFESTWHSAETQPMRLGGRKVAAVFMTRDADLRRRAEDAMAREISARGGVGVPSYTVLSDAEVSNEEASRTALDRAGFDGCVVMRVVGREVQYTVQPVGWWDGPHYRHFWGGGYWGWGWGTPWNAEVRSDTIVRVETLVYSLRRNELVWAGVSRTFDPARIETFIGELAGAVSKEMTHEGILVASS